jgi:hypothetical protein
MTQPVAQELFKHSYAANQAIAILNLLIMRIILLKIVKRNKLLRRRKVERPNTVFI